MSVKLLTGHHLEFLSSKGGCTGSSESTFVKITCRGSFDILRIQTRENDILQIYLLKTFPLVQCQYDFVGL